MKKLKVLHFELDKNLGGIETFVLNLYSQIDREKVQFEFVTTTDEPALGEQLKKLGGIIHKVSPYKKLNNYKKDIEALLDNDYDIVHIHKNSAANTVPLVLSKKHKVPVIIVHSHNTSPSVGKASMLLHKLNKGYLNKTAKYRFACSSEAGRWLFGENSYEVMANGILTKRFMFDQSKRAVKRQELGIPSNALVFGHVGRFTAQKNHQLLIDIFKEIHIKRPESLLLLTGTGELEDDIKRKAVSMGLEESVLFLGVKSDIPELLMCMDAFLMPSLYEGLPIVGIEAQAAGLPIFLSNTISSETELTDGVTWFSIEEPASKIADIILNSGKLDAAADKRIDRNRQIVEKGYDISVTAKKILDYYEQG